MLITLIRLFVSCNYGFFLSGHVIMELNDILLIFMHTKLIIQMDNVLIQIMVNIGQLW